MIEARQYRVQLIFRICQSDSEIILSAGMRRIRHLQPPSAPFLGKKSTGICNGSLGVQRRVFFLVAKLGANAKQQRDKSASCMLTSYCIKVTNRRNCLSLVPLR